MQASHVGREITRRPARRHLLRVVLGLVILVCGGLIGATITSHVLWHRLVSEVRDPEHLPMRMTERMIRTLDLTDEQADSIKQILARRQTQLIEMRQEVAPRMRAEMESLRVQIAAQLTPAQLEQWDAHMERMDKRWLGPHPRFRRNGKGFMHPPPPPGP